MMIDERGFCYESYRGPDGPRRRYLGRIEDAGLFRELDEIWAEEQQLKRDQLQADLDDLAKKQRRVGDLFNLARCATRAVFELGGFIRHNRGAWRMPRR